MCTVIEIMKSLVKMNNWKVQRFDLQYYNYGKGVEGYTGYLDVETIEPTIIIKMNGSFEFAE